MWLNITLIFRNRVQYPHDTMADIIPYKFTDEYHGKKYPRQRVNKIQVVHHPNIKPLGQEVVGVVNCIFEEDSSQSSQYSNQEAQQQDKLPVRNMPLPPQ